MDEEAIKKQAKDILDNFVTALEKVKAEDVRVEREEDRRKERESEESELNSDFRKIMLENAPKTKDDCIEAEKGGWV